MAFASIPEVIEELKAGKMVVLVDDEDRENEGDLVIAAEHCTPEAMNFILSHGRGTVCLALCGEICDRLRLHPQTDLNSSQLGTAFTVTIDAHPKFGVTTGVSARDRSTTVKVAVAEDAQPQDLLRPGHMNPLRARDGGVLVRAGQTEGSVDLCRLAGLKPAAAIIEVMNDDGTMARLPELERFGAKHDLKIISVADLVRYRIHKETLVRKVVETDLPTDYGTFRAAVYENVINGETHIAMTLGDLSQTTEPVLVRVQTENVTFAMFGSQLGDASRAIRSSLKKIAETGRGVILYLRQREHNLDLIHQLQTYALMQEKNLDFQMARAQTGYGSFRDYGIGAQILNDLGVRKIRLLSNHPPRVSALEAFDLEIVETVAL